MRPLFVEWLHVSGLPSWLAPRFWLMLTLAIVAACLLTLQLWKRTGQDLKIASDLLFWGILGLFAGSKIFYFLQYGFPRDAVHWYHPQGFALYGGLAGVLAPWALYRILKP